MSRTVGECIAIPWSYCQPFYYGDYEGRLINGKDCKIDVSNKIKVYDCENNWCGSDEIDIWYCDAVHIKQLTEAIEQRK
jgi:hypothetical protein